MADSESWNERRHQVARYRVMAQETTDPLAARLLHDSFWTWRPSWRDRRKASGLMLHERIAPS